MTDPSRYPDAIGLDPEELRQKILLETGRLGWEELARHFARGVVLVIDPGLDLVEVAARLAEDDTAAMQAWLGAGRLQRARDDNARRWARDGQAFWAVVVRPWVLVQEITASDPGGPPAGLR